MKFRVTTRPAAEADMHHAADWYDDQRSGLGNEFLLAVADSLIQLEESADRYPFYYREFRRLLVDRFPYKVFYRVIGDDVIVFRILHVARDHRRELNE